MKLWGGRAKGIKLGTHYKRPWQNWGWRNLVLILFPDLDSIEAGKVNRVIVLALGILFLAIGILILYLTLGFV